MAKKPSMSAIADYFNISKVTVSKALNNKPGVSENLKAEIIKKAEELNYNFKPKDKNLKNLKIGVLIANRYLGNHPTYYSLVYGKLSLKLSELGYETLLEIIYEDAENNLKVPSILSLKKIDALIVLGELKTPYLKQFENLDLPILFYDFYNYDVDCDALVLDNFYAGYQACELLIKNGHQKIGYVGNVYSTSSIADRFLGMQRALIKNNLALNQEWILDRDEKGNFIDLKLPKQLPTAFVCNNDYVSYLLVKELNKRGYKVPDDISIVTFDNTLFSTILDAKFTCIDNNIDLGIKKCIKAILKKLETHNEKRYGQILVRGNVILRDSIKTLN